MNLGYYILYSIIFYNFPIIVIRMSIENFFAATHVTSSSYNREIGKLDYDNRYGAGSYSLGLLN